MTSSLEWFKGHGPFSAHNEPRTNKRLLKRYICKKAPAAAAGAFCYRSPFLRPDPSGRGRIGALHYPENLR